MLTSYKTHENFQSVVSNKRGGVGAVYWLRFKETNTELICEAGHRTDGALVMQTVCSPVITQAKFSGQELEDLCTVLLVLFSSVGHTNSRH